MRRDSVETRDKEAREETEEEEGQGATKDFMKGPWTDPENMEYGRGRCHTALSKEMAALSNGTTNLEMTESAFITLAEDEPLNYRDTM